MNYKNTKELKDIVEKHFNIDLSVKSSLREYVYPKSILCYLLRQKTPLSIREIKNFLGYKSNQVILYHIQTVESNKLINKFLRKDLEEIEKLLAL
jgi:chromosomal replication initiation ATPase DnaA